jgi:hypothetical protein
MAVLKGLETLISTSASSVEPGMTRIRIFEQEGTEGTEKEALFFLFSPVQSQVPLLRRGMMIREFRELTRIFCFALGRG